MYIYVYVYMYAYIYIYMNIYELYDMYVDRTYVCICIHMIIRISVYTATHIISVM